MKNSHYLPSISGPSFTAAIVAISLITFTTAKAETIVTLNDELRTSELIESCQRENRKIGQEDIFQYSIGFCEGYIASFNDIFHRKFRNGKCKNDPINGDVGNAKSFLMFGKKIPEKYLKYQHAYDFVYQISKDYCLGKID